jgi:nicotinamidase/pyrazinamidase
VPIGPAWYHRPIAMRLAPGDALLVVDVQQDFLPGGALAVPDGDAVVGPLNTAIARFRDAGLPVFASRDWHPAGHRSFAAHGGPWPPHCVADTPGAAFAPGLALPPDVQVISKATDPAREAYSAFAGTDLDDRLRRAGVRRLVLGGLATDYCVRRTAEDARALGYDVVVLLDAVRAVDRRPGAGARALDAIRRCGGGTVGSEALSPSRPGRARSRRRSGGRS